MPHTHRRATLIKQFQAQNRNHTLGLICRSPGSKVLLLSLERLLTYPALLLLERVEP